MKAPTATATASVNMLIRSQPNGFGLLLSQGEEYGSSRRGCRSMPRERRFLSRRKRSPLDVLLGLDGCDAALDTTFLSYVRRVPALGDRRRDDRREDHDCHK
jgi:hypothetical protein